MRFVFKISLFLSALIVGVNSCQTPPDFPDTPKIKFIELKEIDENNLGLVFEFEDGDADLGLLSTQTNPPYNEYNYILANGDTVQRATAPANAVDSVKNLTFSNAIVHTYLLVDGEFQKSFYGIDFSTLDTIPRPDLRFPPVSQKVQNQPVSGTIEVFINTEFFPYRSTDTLRFELYIFDRALHASNRVNTSSFTVN